MYILKKCNVIKVLSLEKQQSLRELKTQECCCRILGLYFLQGYR